MCEPSEWEPLPPRRGEAATGVRAVEQVAAWLYGRIVGGERVIGIDRSEPIAKWSDCPDEFREGWRDEARIVLALPEVAELDICDMWLCEAEVVMLKPDQLYRFEAKDDCDRCQELAAPYRAVLASSSATEPESAGQEVRGG